jgi:hypothetical protein
MDATRPIERNMVESKKFGPGFELKPTMKPLPVQNNPQIPVNQQPPSNYVKYIGPQYVQAPQYTTQQQPINQFVIQPPQQQQQYLPPPAKNNEYKVNQPTVNQQGHPPNTNQYVQYVVQGNSQNIGPNPYNPQK